MSNNDIENKDERIRTLIDSILEKMAAEGKIDKSEIPELKSHYYKGFNVDK